MTNTLKPILLAGLMALPQITFADHGREFLMVQDAHVGSLGHGSVNSVFEWSHPADGTDELSLETTLFLPVAERLALGTGLRLDDTDSWGYAGVAPHLLLDLTPAHSPIRLAIQAGYNFANSLDHAEEPADSHHAEEEQHSEEKHHEHSGVHQHGSSGWELRGIAEMDVTENTKAVANLVYVNTEDGESAWGYGVGVRQMLSTRFGLGVEATGDLGNAHSSEHEVMLGGYFAPIHDLTFKAGIGFGLTKESPDVVARVGLAWRF